MKIAIINGPNLNKVGEREPEIYGTETFQDLLMRLEKTYPQVELVYYQSNSEGALIDYLQAANEEVDGIVLNAAAYTHTSIAISDAVRSMKIPVIEVHLSNTFAREKYRHKSYLSPHVAGVILGFGMQSYELAVQALLNLDYV